ncbi:MAG: phosphatase PAP2 family protein [Spirochaetota bacterium]|nr:phosphatase PAP2 family protein [Spirochaetota bacterium]
MEQEIAIFFWNLRDTFLFNIFEFISGKFYILLTSSIFISYAVYKLKKGSLRFFIVVALSVSFSDIFCYRVLKPMIGRDRPKVELNITQRSISKRAKDYSMPSNHASNISAFFIVYFFLVRRFFGILLINSLLICLSRIILVKHYPTDILLGIAVGITVGLFSVYLSSFFIRDETLE